MRSLHRRLAEYITSDKIDQKGQHYVTQTSVPTDLLHNRTDTISPIAREISQGGSMNSQAPVLVQLLRKVTPLSSEEPEEILRLFVWLGEINDLGMFDDRHFIKTILPLVSGSLLKFLGGCLREECSWAGCKSRLMEEYFPYFVRERLIRDLIVFKFHAAGQSMRAYVEHFFFRQMIFCSTSIRNNSWLIGC